jgi:hypothetical protein
MTGTTGKPYAGCENGRKGTIYIIYWDGTALKKQNQRNTV